MESPDQKFNAALQGILQMKTNKEDKHVEADHLVADALEQAGLTETAKTYRDAIMMGKFWYA